MGSHENQAGLDHHLGQEFRDGHCLRPLDWPHTEALALFSRSDSRNTLKSLSLVDVVLTESELLICLAPTYLFISDHLPRDGVVGPPHHLITDSLLGALTPPINAECEATCLIPNLAILDLRSLGCFSVASLRQFLIGRTTVIAGLEERFECALLWFPGHRLYLDLDNLMHLRDWTRKRELLFSCRDFGPED